MPSAKSNKGQAGCLVASIMLVVVSIGTFTFCSLEYMRIHKSCQCGPNGCECGQNKDKLSPQKCQCGPQECQCGQNKFKPQECECGPQGCLCGQDKFKNMQSFGVYGFDPEVTSAPLNTNSSLETDFSAQVDSTPEPLMSSVETQEPQLSSVKSIDDDEAQYEYKFDDDKKAFIKYKKTQEHEDNQSKYLQFMKDTYDIDLNENTKDEQPQGDMKEMMNEQPVLEASNSGSYAEMIKNKQGVTDEASASPNLKAGIETIDSDSEAEYEKYVKNLQGLDLNEKQSPDEQMFKGDERNSEYADYLKERYGIDLNSNADRKADPKNQDEIDERQILELLRDNSSANEEDNTATQPMLQASNQVDAEKNHREQREYMMKLYDIDIDDYLTDNASKRDMGAEPVQPVLRTSNTDTNADQDRNTQDDEEIKMQEYLNLLKQMDEEENTPSLRAPMDKQDNVDIDDMSEQAEYLKKLYGVDIRENKNTNTNMNMKNDQPMLRSTVPEQSSEIDESKFEEYLRLLKDIEEEESKQNTDAQPRLMNSFDADSSNSMSDEDKMARDRDEYAEYMKKLYDIDVNEYKMNKGVNLRSEQEPVQKRDFNRSIYDQFEADNAYPQLSEPLEAPQGEFDREMYRDFENSLRSSQADDELEGPIVSPTPFIRDQPRLSSSYDDVSDNTQDMRSNKSNNLDAEYADYMKRLQGINIDDAN